MARAAKPSLAQSSDSATRSGARHYAEVATAFALLATAWAADPSAAASFDAPKRLLALCAASIVTAALLWAPHGPNWREWTRAGLAICVLSAGGVFMILVSAWCAPDPLPASVSLRPISLFAAFLLLGASNLLTESGWRRLAVAALCASVGNAALSLLQAAGFATPFALQQIGGRYPTGALLGNEGYVALSSALAAAGGLAYLLRRGGAARRGWIGLAVLISVAAILVNRQLTAGLALAAALCTVLAAQVQAFRWLAALALAGLFVVGSALVPLAQNAPLGPLALGSVADYQRLTTNRLGAWAAATEMIRNRPLTGYGPGSFAAQAQTQRLAAEIRLGQRLPPPPPAAAFVWAHQDYLQSAAEFGIPAALALIAAWIALLIGLIRRAGPAEAIETRMLLGILTVGAVAALAWFPLHIPFLALLLALAAGRAWRILASPERGAP